MALGTLTAVANTTNRVGNRREKVYDVQLTSGANYTTGGETITPAMVGLGRRIEQVQATGTPRATTGGATERSVSWDFATLVSTGAVKMQVSTTASAEAANNSDQSAFSVRVAFRGV